MTNKEAKEKLYMEWQKFLEDNIDYAGISEAYKMAFKALEQEPKTGRWIDGKCNRCGTHAPYWAMASTYYCSEYCPNCGARMVEPNMSENPTGSKDVIWYSKRNYSEIVVEPQESEG